MLQPESRKRRIAPWWAGLALLLAAVPAGVSQLDTVAAGTGPQNCGNCQGNSGSGGGNGGSSGGGSPGKALIATATNVTPIAPGRGGTVTVQVENPNNQAVLVTKVAGIVTSVTTGSRPGLQACSKDWFALGEFNGSKTIAKNASGTVTMPVGFVNKTFNQDNCKNVIYNFSFTVYGQQS
jgi:hypothetical protein